MGKGKKKKRKGKKREREKRRKGEKGKGAEGRKIKKEGWKGRQKRIGLVFLKSLQLCYNHPLTCVPDKSMGHMLPFTAYVSC